jgi:REP element-mobilizing transposase RayT
VHFVSFAVTGWVDVFTRKEYKDIVLHSLRFCQKEKGMVLYGWCIMSNHVHLILSARNNNLSDLLRDFKKFTSKRLIAAIQNNRAESRREWMLQIFKSEGEKNSRNQDFQFWRQHNQPKECYSKSFTDQKLDYIHNNPVEAGLVDKAEEYLYSSARDYHHGKNVGLLTIEWL